MPVKVISTIKPNGIALGSSQFPTVEDIDTLGGFQVQATDASRNAIPAANRKQGMLVYVIADSSFYQLAADLVTWNAASFGSDVTLSGDVTGAGVSNTVVKLQNHSVSSTAPALSDNLSWNAANNDWEPNHSSKLSVRLYGAVGDGATDDRTSIHNADVAAAAASPIPYALVFPAGTYKIHTNITIASPIIFEYGAKLSIDTGVTVTLSNKFQAHNKQQIFSGLGTVAFTTHRIMPGPFVPEWWGAVGDGVIDDYTAIQNMINVAVATSDTEYGAPVLLEFHFSSSYAISNTLVFFGSAYGLVTGEMGTGFTWIGSFDDTVTNPVPMIWMKDCQSMVWKDIICSVASPHQLAECWRLSTVSGSPFNPVGTQNTFYNCQVQNAEIGWRVGRSDSDGNNDITTWMNCSSRGNGTPNTTVLIEDGESFNNTFINCTFVNSGGSVVTNLGHVTPGDTLGGFQLVHFDTAGLLSGKDVGKIVEIEQSDSTVIRTTVHGFNPSFPNQVTITDPCPVGFTHGGSGGLVTGYQNSVSCKPINDLGHVANGGGGGFTWIGGNTGNNLGPDFVMGTANGLATVRDCTSEVSRQFFVQPGAPSQGRYKALIEDCRCAGAPVVATGSVSTDYIHFGSSGKYEIRQCDIGDINANVPITIYYGGPVGGIESSSSFILDNTDVSSSLDIFHTFVHANPTDVRSSFHHFAGGATVTPLNNFFQDRGSNSSTTTTIAVASNGVSLPQATINVASTASFPASGIVYVPTSAGLQQVTYTGVSGGNQFTGCTGGTGAMSTGGIVIGTVTIDWGRSRTQGLNISGDIGFVFTNIPEGLGGTFRLILTSNFGTGPWTIGWPSTVQWLGDPAPLLNYLGVNAFIPTIIDFTYTASTSTLWGGPVIFAKVVTDTVASFEQTLVNGDNNNIVTRNAHTLLVLGPTAPFSIGGLVAPFGWPTSSGMDGFEITIWNNVFQTMTIKNQDASSLPANRIYTNTGTDVVLAPNSLSVARLRYNAPSSSWFLVDVFPAVFNSTAITSGTVNTQNQTFPNYIKYGRTTGVSGTVTLNVPVPNNTTAHIQLNIEGRVVIAGGSASVGDVFAYYNVIPVKNIAHSLSIVGGTLSAALVNQADTSQSSDTVTTTNGTDSINFIVTQAGSTNTGTIDWTIYASVGVN